MKKLMIASLSLSLLSGVVAFAQNTSTDTMKDTMKGKKHKKSKKSDTMSGTSTSAK